MTRRRLRAFLSRLRLVPHRGRLVDEVTEELEAHIDLLAERYVRAGLPAAEARLAAQRQLGNTTRVREEIHTMHSLVWLEALVSDVRYAARLLARQPVFALAATATVALGIGATTAIFSVAYAVLVAPLPYAEPDRLFTAEIVVPERREQIPSLPASVQAYLAWRNASPEFSAMAALRPWEGNLTGGTEPERVGGARVSTNFFDVLGVPVARGRGFLPEEERPGSDRVVVISDGLWRRRYGADPAIVGRSIAVNGEDHQVVGIAPPSLLVPTRTQLHALVPFDARVDIWRPIAPTPTELKGESWDHGMVLRLAPGGHLETGRRQLETVLNDLVRVQLPTLKTTPLVQVTPIREIYAGRIRQRLVLVLSASMLLLLTSCAGLANLMLARVATRSVELATRLALGAGRARLASLTLADASLVTLVGAACGIGLATLGLRWLVEAGPDDVRLLATPHLSLPMLAFAALASALTALACGAQPVWRASGSRMGVTLQGGGRALGGRPGGRTRRLLVGAEMALATALLASAGLLVHSFARLLDADRGYHVDHVLAAELSLFGDRYDTSQSRAALYGELVARLQAQPGVSAAGLISELPAVASSYGASRSILLPDDVLFSQVVLTRPIANIRSITGGYFAASGTPLLAGRPLLEDEPALTAVISEALARRLWPGDPIASSVGRQIRQGNSNSPLIAIVGVVADARPGALDREPLPVVYRPYRQWASGSMSLVLRTASDPDALAPVVRTTVRALDPDLPVVGLRSMQDIVSGTVRDRQFQMTLTSVFGILALLLGVVGLYGVVSYAVACGSRDIGVRIALGATRTDVMRTVFRHGMPPVMAGLVVGLAGAVAAATALRSLLFEIAPTDPVSLAVVTAVLLITSAAACYLPARRAARIDPITALRAE